MCRAKTEHDSNNNTTEKSIDIESQQIGTVTGINTSTNENLIFRNFWNDKRKKNFIIETKAIAYSHRILVLIVEERLKQFKV